jgi:hypothetical protein
MDTNYLYLFSIFSNLAKNRFYFFLTFKNKFLFYCCLQFCEFLFLLFFYFFITYFPQLHFQCYPKSPPHPPPPHSPTHPFLFFWPWRSPVLGHIKFACPMGLSFQWWPTRPSFDTYAARVKSSGVLVSSYCCSTYQVADPFSSLGTFSSSSIGDPVIPFWVRSKHPLLGLLCYLASLCFWIAAWLSCTLWLIVT